METRLAQREAEFEDSALRYCLCLGLVGQMQNLVHRDQFRLEKIHRQICLSQMTYINKDVDRLLNVKIVAWTAQLSSLTEPGLFIHCVLVFLLVNL